MKTKYFIFAASALVALASCSNEEYIGDNSLTSAEGDGSIQFSYSMPNAVRSGDIYGDAAATKLGGNFYVVGTKGTEGTKNPTTQAVFDNYLVHYKANTAGTTESNTANWEYVGVVPGTAPTANYVKLSPANVTAQTIKYWDYSQPQYDFFAFSTGDKHAVSGDPASTSEVGVTAMLYGSALDVSSTVPTAYTFKVYDTDGLSNIYITDITEVKKADNKYGQDVVLKFKNLGSKLRIALYETVPGYSVQAGSVVFYAADGTPVDPDAGGYAAPNTTGKLICGDAVNGFPTRGTIAVKFPNVGTANESNANYNKATVDVTADWAGADEMYKTFGTIGEDQMVKRETRETADENAKLYIGRTLPTASFVGDKNSDFYQLAFPVDDSSPITLRVNYTLISTDGSGETITIHGAKAVVPATYTKWQPNYAYTYIFKISDNTNGMTDYSQEGLFPITFDAVVADFADVSGEQRTVTTVATPSITTYQQFHSKSANEYSRTVKNQTGADVTKDIYVQVIKSDGSLANDLTGTTGSPATNRSILYGVAAGTTEAQVMDALEKRTAEDLDDTPIVGRNGVTLTPNAKLTNGVATIENGVDDKAITVAAGTTAKIAKDIDAGTYAYVYDYSTANKEVVEQFQPIDVSGGTVGSAGKTYYSLTTAALNGETPAVAEVTIDDAHVYFSKTTTDGVNYTYSYISVTGKTKLPIGTVAYAKASITTTVAGGTAKADNTFYFDKYFSNDGKYAVKVIKIE